MYVVLMACCRAPITTYFEVHCTRIYYVVRTSNHSDYALVPYITVVHMEIQKIKRGGTSKLAFFAGMSSKACLLLPPHPRHVFCSIPSSGGRYFASAVVLRTAASGDVLTPRVIVFFAKDASPASLRESLQLLLYRHPSCAVASDHAHPTTILLLLLSQQLCCAHCNRSPPIATLLSIDIFMCSLFVFFTYF